MNRQEKLNLIAAYADLGRAIEEIIFCVIHPQLTGPHRRNEAIKIYAEVSTRIDEIREGIEK